MFSKTFEQNHRALSDTVACKDCYYEMLKRWTVFILTSYQYQ
jgi:DNA polymerase III epsilon subunit-like protein